MKEIALNLFHKYKNDNVSEAGAQLTYYLILAIFPFLISLLHIIEFTPLNDMEVLENLLVALPTETRTLLTNLVKEVISSSSTALLSVGVLGTLWSGSNGLMSLIKAVNRAYDLEESRPYWKLKLLSIAMTIGLIIVIILVFSVNIFSNILFERFVSGFFPNSQLVFKVIQIVLVFASVVIILSLLYKFSPSLKKEFNVTFKEALPGGIFSTLGLLISSLGFSIYVDNFANYSKVYGSLGGIIVLLIWLYITSIIIVLGAELNSILIGRDLREGGSTEA